MVLVAATISWARIGRRFPFRQYFGVLPAITFEYDASSERLLRTLTSSRP
jgi:hypothetical protein